MSQVSCRLGRELFPCPQIDQIRKDLEMRGKNWEEVQKNRKWENRDG
jgi:hypothetical protein